MKPTTSILFVFLGLMLAGNGQAASKDQQPYKVGERLPAATSQPGAYRALNWDELMPTDWDPMKALKGLDLAKMDDADPRAIKALEKVRGLWNDAPVVPALNGARIEIPGFVVPLDVDTETVREFLLVPYFGACIHVPPPPSNQVLHVLTPKNISKEQKKALKNAVLLYGALSVSGTLEVVSTQTLMGFASYRLKAEQLSAYKPPANN